MSADKRYEIECKTTGSRPEATVTWWKNNRQLKRMAKNVRPLCHCPLINRFFSIPLSHNDRVSLLSVGYFFRKTFLILVYSMLYFYFTFVVVIVFVFVIKWFDGLCFNYNFILSFCEDYLIFHTVGAAIV